MPKNVDPTPVRPHHRLPDPTHSKGTTLGFPRACFFLPLFECLYWRFWESGSFYSVIFSIFSPHLSSTLISNYPQLSIILGTSLTLMEAQQTKSSHLQEPQEFPGLYYSNPKPVRARDKPWEQCGQDLIVTVPIMGLRHGLVVTVPLWVLDVAWW